MLWLGLSFGWSLDMMRLSFNLSILALVFALGKFSYFGESGFGVFVAGLGGYHVALDDSESGVYQ